MKQFKILKGFFKRRWFIGLVVKVLGGSLLSNVNCYCLREVIWLVYIGVGRLFSHLIGIDIQQYLHSNILLINPHVNLPLNSSFN